MSGFVNKVKKYVSDLVSFVFESRTELAKVHFPSPKETAQATVVVVVLSVTVALWLGLIDLAATRLVQRLLH